jgi:glutathione synthase/RimK-type ligase-like ATP-grasp enzyme
MTRIALVTAQASRALDEDLAPLQKALENRGAEVLTPNWDDAAFDWHSVDLALLRSPWDYTLRLPEFLTWVDAAAKNTRLLNPPPVVRWNTDKHYLYELGRAGIAIVRSAFIEPGEAASGKLDAFLAEHTDDAEFVVKPCVGAGSRDAQRYTRGEREPALAHAQRLLGDGRSVLLQPYLDRVDEHGETALIFFDGEFSHAIRKGPLLRRGEGPTRALFAAEHIVARQPSAEELALARATLAAIPFGSLLYARVDVIQAADGTPRLLELELTEPSLFFEHAAGSAQRFAAAVLART